MASTNAQPQSTPAQQVSYRTMGRWLGTAALGMGAWILVSVLTAMLDPRAGGAGLLDVFDSLSAFLGTGAALTGVPMAAYGIYRYGFGRRATLCLAVALLALVFVLIVTHWQAVLSGIGGLAMIGIVLVAIYFSPPGSQMDTDDDDNGWRNGWQGVGWYSQGVRIDSDIDEE